jgi:recA bacterial DNA recombination protein
MGAPSVEVERLLEGSGLQPKRAALSLLSGLGARLTRASDLPSPSAPRDPLPTTVAALDRLLAGGLPRGGFVEVSGRRSSGRFSIGVATLASATSNGEAAALVDLGGHLDPQSAEEAGVDLTRLLWVRPAKLKDAVASAEMTLAAGFPLVVLDLGLAPVRGRIVPDAAWVRLERAARQRSAALLLLAPYRISGVAAEAVLAADAVRPIWRGAAGAPRLLAGVTSRLTLQKDARARSGVAEQMGLFIDGAPPAISSLLAATGERGFFSVLPLSPKRGAFSNLPLTLGEGRGEGRRVAAVR